MSDDRRVSVSSAAPLSSDQLARYSFSTVFRGYDPSEVRSLLERVAGELAAAGGREGELRRRLDDAEARAAHPRLDAATLTAALGDETARVIHSAQKAADDIRAKAEENATRILRDAHDESGRLRAAAEGVLGQRTREAESAAAEIVRQAEDAAEEVRARAQAEVGEIRARAHAEAQAALDEALKQSREMVAEARAVRERVLLDLARRRRLAQVQLEQLRAGRDRLLDAYRLVRRTLDDVTDELERSEAAARAAAETAGGGPRPDGAAPGHDVEGVGGELDQVPHQGPSRSDQGLPTASAASAASGGSAAPVAGAGAPGEPGSALGMLRRSRGGRRQAHERIDLSALERAEEPGALEDETSHLAVDGGVGEAEAGWEDTGEVAGSPGSGVDDLFARMRSGRVEAVARAQAVLAETAVDAMPGPVDPGSDLGSARAEERAEQEVLEPAGDGDEAMLRRRDSVLEPLAARLSRKLKRALQDEQNALLDRVRMHRDRPTPTDVLAPEADQRARCSQAAVRLLEEAAQAGAVYQGGEPGGRVPVDDLAEGLAGAIVEPLRSRLERGLGEAFGDDDQAAVVARVSAAFREWKGQRTERLAVDQLVAAFARGALAATPADVALRWVVDDEDGPCPDCDDNALAGPTPPGEEYPTGQPHPPAHAGCRCLLVPAVP